ncbi:ESCRT-II complex subunit-domain-containing protein [Entophlyctis helioformis]|nr:ESCRT-II complex subunit-domain-containing protein [Entophlyctis helioformis]
MASFAYPAIYSFPPFFTYVGRHGNRQQPTVDTWHKQRQLWCELILAHAEHARIFVVDVNEVVGKAEPYHNPKIRRSLPRETLVLLLETLVSQRNAEWDNKDHTRCLLHWRKPDEWASLIYKWIFDTGRTGSVCTTYEIIHGDEAADQPFYEIPDMVLKKALDVLVKQGRAQTFASSDGSIGVKFT